MPKPKATRPRITLKELEDYDAPRKGVKLVFHRVFNFVMRRRIEEMVWESNMEDDELRAHKRTRELKSVQRRILFNYAYVVIAPVCVVLAVKSGLEKLASGSPWAALWLVLSVFWIRSSVKDWRTLMELRKRRMELIVEDVHDH